MFGSTSRAACSSVRQYLFVSVSTLSFDLLSVSVGLSLAAGLLFTTPADAREKRRAEIQPQIESVAPAPTSPLTMIISLNKQRLYVYDANGFVTTSRVSTGMPGFDTPKGIYSIIQKKEEHVSNIYEGASMPYMQRLLQTGIAMHAGVVPGYPASHGCIRLPFSFAPKLFQMTTMNERVIVTPDVQSPVPIEHPTLFAALPKGDGSAPQAILLERTAATDVGTVLGITPAAASEGVHTLASVKAERVRERERLVAAIETAKADALKAQDAIPLLAKAADDAKKDHKAAALEKSKADRAADKALDAQKAAERTLKGLNKRMAKTRIRADELEALRQQALKAEADVKTAAAAATTAREIADRAKTALDGAKTKLNAAEAARAGSKKAARAATDVIAAAEKRVAVFDRQEANRSLPITVLITPKTRNISVRQGWETIAEAPITIADPALPVGTHLFTATSWRDGSETELKWTTTSVGEQNPPMPEEKSDRRSKKEKADEVVSLPPATDATKAAAVLSRISVPADMQVKIAAVVKPGSTVIISDFDMARSEVRPGTDFTVQMPEVVAKITKPERKKIEQEFEDDDKKGGWFFFSAPPPAPKYKRRATVGGNKWGSW